MLCSLRSARLAIAAPHVDRSMCRANVPTAYRIAAGDGAQASISAAVNTTTAHPSHQHPTHSAPANLRTHIYANRPMSDIELSPTIESNPGVAATTAKPHAAPGPTAHTAGRGQSSPPRRPRPPPRPRRTVVDCSKRGDKGPPTSARSEAKGGSPRTEQAPHGAGEAPPAEPRRHPQAPGPGPKPCPRIGNRARRASPASISRTPSRSRQIPPSRRRRTTGVGASASCTSRLGPSPPTGTRANAGGATGPRPGAMAVLGTTPRLAATRLAWTHSASASGGRIRQAARVHRGGERSWAPRGSADCRVVDVAALRGRPAPLPRRRDRLRRVARVDRRLRAPGMPRAVGESRNAGQLARLQRRRRRSRGSRRGSGRPRPGCGVSGRLASRVFCVGRRNRPSGRARASSSRPWKATSCPSKCSAIAHACDLAC
jgi:hypothetical protein